MAGDDERLVVLLEARIRDFEKNMQKASGTAGRTYGQLTAGSSRATRQMEQDFQRSTARINQLLSSTRTQIGGLASAFGGGFLGGLASGGIAGLVNTLGSVAKGIAEIGDQAKKAGLSTKAFQELKYVAEQNRVGVDALTDGMKELSLRADEFITTGQGSAAESFQRLGYDAGTLATKLKDPSKLFTEIIGKLGQLDKAAQIRIADELFGGTGGEQFVQLISQGEAGIRSQIQAANDLGIVLDEKLIKKADEVDRKFQQITTTVGTGLKRAIVECVDALQGFGEELTKIGDKGILNGGVSAPSSILPDTGALIGGNLQKLIEERKQLQEQANLIQQGISDDIKKGFGAAPSEVDERTAAIRRIKEIDELIAKQHELTDAKRETLAVDDPNAIRRDAHPDDANSYSRDPFRSTVDLPKTIANSPNLRGVDDVPEPEKAAKAGDTMAAAFIKNFEGFISKSKWDVNAYRAGYGSDTFTREDGSVGRVSASTSVTFADANRDLERRLGEFQKTIEGQIGGETFKSFSDEQKAALTSIAYNYGDLPDRIVSAIKTGSPEKVGTAIRDLGDDNSGINRSRRSKEADMFLSGTGSGDTPAIAQAKLHKDAIEDLQKSYEKLGDIGVTALEGLADALADGKLEGREVLQIVVKLIEQLLTMPGGLSGLFGGKGGAPASGGGGGIFSAIGSIFGSIFGGGGAAADPWAGLRLADGGSVSGPGTSTSDSIPAMLSKGEFVINAASAARHRTVLEAINANRIPHFASGGPVGGSSGSPAFGGGKIVVNVNNNGTTTNVSERQDADGTQHVDIEAMVNGMVAKSLNRPNSVTQRALQNQFVAPRRLKQY